MQYALDAQGVRVLPGNSVAGFCPGCKICLKAKALASQHVRSYWSHKSGDCDPWYEPEGEWHREWKSRWPEECREVVIGPHRADVRTKEGLVIELQHSAISSDEILERETFYGNMMWILDARAWDIGCREKVYVGESDEYAGETFPQYEVSFTPLREMCLEDQGKVTVTWRRPKRSWSASTKSVWLDIAPGCLLLVDWWGWTASVGCCLKGTVVVVDAAAYASHVEHRREIRRRWLAAARAEAEADPDFVRWGA